MTQALKVGDERAVVMDPSTPRGDGGAEGHPTDLKEEKWEEKGEGEGIQEDLMQEPSVVGQAPLSGLVRQ
jgi:hypothetical protein